jgi:hypothetical protein
MKNINVLPGKANSVHVADLNKLSVDDVAMGEEFIDLSLADESEVSQEPHRMGCLV